MYSSEADINIERGKGVEILYSEEAILQVRLTAPELIQFSGQDAYTEMPESFELQFFNQHQKVESFLHADYGIIFDKRQLMRAVGNVVLKNKKGEQLFAEELNWDQDKKLIYSDKFVKIVTEEEILFGEGFESNEDFTEYTIKNLTGTIELEKPLKE